MCFMSCKKKKTLLNMKTHSAQPNPCYTHTSREHTHTCTHTHNAHVSHACTCTPACTDRQTETLKLGSLEPPRGNVTAQMNIVFDLFSFQSGKNTSNKPSLLIHIHSDVPQCAVRCRGTCTLHTWNSSIQDICGDKYAAVNDLSSF